MDPHRNHHNNRNNNNNNNNVVDDDDELLNNGIRRMIIPPDDDNDDDNNNDPNNNNNNNINNNINLLPPELVHHPAVLAFQVARASFLVTDPRLPGNPIIYASRGFLELTGYGIDRVLGRNCRFLQGPETDPLAVAKMRECLDRGCDVTVTLLNYRHDGSTFWNHILISGIRMGGGGVGMNTTTTVTPEGGGDVPMQPQQPQQQGVGDVRYFLGLQCPVKPPQQPVDALSASSSSSSIVMLDNHSNHTSSMQE